MIDNERIRMRIKIRLRGSAGFTLIELLVVMIILGLLASLVGPRLFGKVDKAKQQTAQAQIELLSTALASFRLDIGRFPTEEEGLNSLIERPSNLQKWDGSYLAKEIPKDPWGNDYVYKMPGEHGPYDLMSYGMDGVSGGEGNDLDIVSWKSLE
jgi:general secretion pathway protein G